MGEKRTRPQEPERVSWVVRLILDKSINSTKDLKSAFEKYNNGFQIKKKQKWAPPEILQLMGEIHLTHLDKSIFGNVRCYASGHRSTLFFASLASPTCSNGALWDFKSIIFRSSLPPTIYLPLVYLVTAFVPSLARRALPILRGEGASERRSGSREMCYCRLLVVVLKERRFAGDALEYVVCEQVGDAYRFARYWWCTVTVVDLQLQNYTTMR